LDHAANYPVVFQPVTNSLYVKGIEFYLLVNIKPKLIKIKFKICLHMPYKYSEFHGTKFI